ncbi:MAG TPA: hypothetical protein VLB07_13660, partial [Woeseiaceae bacterium]|nr:hypothetical protein [Woeseiaceae bacterium]
DHFLACRGASADSAAMESVSREDGRTISEILLTASCGPPVRLRLLLPDEAETQKVGLLLLIGGHRTGRNAVDLIGDPAGIAYAAIDYPYRGSHSLSGASQIIRAIPAIQDALLDTPPALMLAMDWISRQPWFDAGHAELAGISLGVPLAAVAGALDDRFTRVWLIHGATNNYDWVMHAAENRVRNRVLRDLSVRASLLLAYGNSFRTADWLREIAPRPVVIIAARDDERMPQGATAAYRTASESEHVSLMWTQGKHIEPGREYELQQLVDLVVGEMQATSDNFGQGADLLPMPGRLP